MSGAKTFAVTRQEQQQRKEEKEEEKAIKRETAIQERIAQIRAGQRRTKVVVQLPSLPTQVNDSLARDAQTQVEALKSKLPQIESEYQALVAKQIVDAQTVRQALELTAQALNNNQLTVAQTHLQALDDARCQAMQVLQAERKAQIQYLQARFEELRSPLAGASAPSRLPQAIVQEMEARLANFQTNWQHFTDTQLQQTHTDLNNLEAQIEEVREAADKLVNCWLEAGYNARVLGVDDGDAVIEIATHEGENTQMRVQFSGQQIDLLGPPEETESCRARTLEALRLFQQQGYQLEWTSWDGQEVPQELRHLYSTAPQTQSVSRRMQAQEY
ncbi:hypothetical protein NUACC21_64150 [Scytonema sp. NUACC21]